MQIFADVHVRSKQKESRTRMSSLVRKRCYGVVCFVYFKEKKSGYLTCLVVVLLARSVISKSQYSGHVKKIDVMEIILFSKNRAETIIPCRIFIALGF